MKVIVQDQLDGIDPNFNYLVLLNNGSKRPIRMIIYQYKTSAKEKWASVHETSGEYILDVIPEELAPALEKYIIDEVLISGEYLFCQLGDHNKGYSASQFSKLVSVSIFEKFTGVHTTVNGLRKSYVSYKMCNMPPFDQQENMVWAMGTSVDLLLNTYFRVELTSP
jgi:hypothetical protein